MFDIVVCSTSLDLMNRSIKVINKALIGYEFDYRIDKFKSINSKLKNTIISNKINIYIVDIDMLDIVYKIRENDFKSIIILISSHDKIDINIFHEKLLFLDYICFDNCYDDNLIKDINVGFKILFSNNVFSFMYNHMLYRIPYSNINYIEKELNIKRCIIHTLDKKYYVVNSICGIINELDGMFVKSSQSCIINLMNVEYVDCTNDVIYFKNGDVTNLVTAKVIKIIKECVK